MGMLRWCMACEHMRSRCEVDVICHMWYQHMRKRLLTIGSTEASGMFSRCMDKSTTRRSFSFVTPASPPSHMNLSMISLSPGAFSPARWSQGTRALPPLYTVPSLVTTSTQAIFAVIDADSAFNSGSPELEVRFESTTIFTYQYTNMKMLSYQ